MTGFCRPALAPFLVTAGGFVREMLEKEVPAGEVGSHIRIVAEADNVVSHCFDALKPGYVGWMWVVVVVYVLGSQKITVSEICLLAGEDALLSPKLSHFGEISQCDPVLVDESDFVVF